MPQVSSARQVTTSEWRGKGRGGEGRGGEGTSKREWLPPPWPALEPYSHLHTPSSKTAHTEVAAELVQQLAPG